MQIALSAFQIHSEFSDANPGADRWNRSTPRSIQLLEFDISTWIICRKVFQSLKQGYEVSCLFSFLSPATMLVYLVGRCRRFSGTPIVGTHRFSSVNGDSHSLKWLQIFQDQGLYAVIFAL